MVRHNSGDSLKRIAIIEVQLNIWHLSTFANKSNFGGNIWKWALHFRFGIKISDSQIRADEVCALFMFAVVKDAQKSNT